MIYSLQRAISGPVLITVVLGALAAVVPVLPQGWLLAWLLLGLTAGYALSGSA